MSQDQESPDYSYDEILQACREIEGLGEEEFPEASQEASLFSSSLIYGTLEEASAAEIPCTPQDPQSTCFSSTAVTTTSVSKSDEGFSSQEEQESSSALESMPGNDNSSRDPLDEKVALLVQFLLLKYQMKEVITKEDMLKMVIKEHEDHFPEILSMASERMELVFGVDVMEVDPISHCYALLNKLGLTYDGMASSDEGIPKTGLLIFVLGVIFMKGSRATEEDIWKVLNRLDIHSGQNHFIYGEPRKFITEDLVLEKYLEYRRVPNSDPAYEFLWGPRAHAETTKMKVLEFVARVHGTDPSSFPSQYEEALKDEEERAQAKAAASPGATAMAGASSGAMSSIYSDP
ncbi:LOW QUALITY PROTEIN: melanoma-associated antigen B16-like [Trichechus inunguis]